jgi:hypothetical protein
MRRIHSFLSNDALLHHGTKSAVEGLQGFSDSGLGVDTGADTALA